MVKRVNINLSKIKDIYIREAFKNIIDEFIDRTSVMRATLVPDKDGAYSIGTKTRRLDAVHTKELFVDQNTVYMGGEPVLTVDKGTITLSGGKSKDITLKASGTGTVHLNAESGTAKVNGKTVQEEITFKNEYFTVGTEITGLTATIINTPLSGSERVILNGLELSEGATRDYTIATNVITFTAGVIENGDGVKISYVI